MQYLFFGIKTSRKAETDIDPERFSPYFFRRLDEELERASYKNVTKNNHERIFKGAVFRFIWNGWNLFNPITNGKIGLKFYNKSIYIKHEIFFWEFFVYTLLFSIIPAVGIFPELFYRFIALGIILMIYLISTLLAASRLENLFNKIVEEMNEIEEERLAKEGNAVG